MTAGLWLCVPALVIASVWYPLVRQYRVETTPVPGDTVEQMRSEPADFFLDELTEFSFVVRWNHSTEILASADSILAGRMQIPILGFAPISIDPSFDPDDLTKGAPEVQLYLAALHIPDVLLDAYGLSGDRRYFDAARVWLVHYADFEQGLCLPHGLVFNGQATASRVLVLAKLWKYGRHRNLLGQDDAGTIMELADRTRRLLMKPSTFTANSNYAVMQAGALCAQTILFPLLTDQEACVDTAVARLTAKMPSYVSEEGVILEHSPGYHRDGMQFLAFAFRCLSLAGRPIPEDWRNRYDAGLAFLGAVQRPDLSLPRIGDTEDAVDLAGLWSVQTTDDGRAGILERRLDLRPDTAAAFFPISGYQIWWQGLNRWPNGPGLSQTAVTWSHFPGHAHKHADELSMVVWADGHDWITNTGYPSYGSEHRSPGLSWRGSNAPHLLGEPYSSERSSSALYAATSDSARFVDLLRKGPGRFEARRQILQLGAGNWLVLDLAQGDSQDSVSTVWTFSIGSELAEGGAPNSYRIDRSDDTAQTMSVAFASAGASFAQYSGSMEPYAGWEIVHCSAQPVPAIELRAPAHSYGSLALFALEGDSGTQAASPGLQATDPENWTASFVVGGDTVSISRQDSILTCAGGAPAAPSFTLHLTQVPAVASERADIAENFKGLNARYPKFRDLLPERTKVTWALVILLIVQELAVWLTSRLAYRLGVALRLAALVCWIGGGIWLQFWYLNPLRLWTGF